MPIETDWVIISGPPSSGKTTLLHLFAEAGEQTVPDQVRAMITREVAGGRDAEEFRFSDDFQPMAIAAMHNSERTLDPSERRVLEYGSPCNIAFHRTEGRPVPRTLQASSQEFRYRAVFILEPVGWRRDSERVEDEEYQATVYSHMWEVYRELDYYPIGLPAVPPEHRLHIAQTALRYL